jgi:phosphatidate cytidylyltransferase
MRFWTSMNPPVLAVFSTLLVLLVIASVWVAVLKRRHPDKDYRELGARVGTWWLILGLFAGALLFGFRTSLLFFAFVSFLALKEYYSLIPTRRADRRVLFWAYLAIPLQYYWVSMEWYGMFAVFIPVYMFLFIPLRMVLIGETAGFLSAAGTVYWGLMTTVYSLSHAAYLLRMPMKGGSAWKDELTGGVTLVLYLVVLTQLNDILQYIWGKSIGGAKVVPAVSPGKTWAGFLGGVASTTVLATILGPFLTPLTHVQSMLAGLIIGIFGFVGDITISAVKRDLHIKDSGTTLPGHGGILDRVDSLTYTAPLFFHFVRYLYF